MKKMDRRAFLKLAPKAAVGLTLTGLGVAGSEKLRKKEEERITGADEAIEHFLGIKEGKSTIHFNLINHVLTPADEQRIIDTNATVILGELSQNYIQKKYLIDNLNSNNNTINIETLFSLDIGSSKKEMVTHYQILLSILENKSQHLVATDPRIGHLSSEKTHFRNLVAKRKGVFALSGGVAIATMFSYIKENNIKKEKKISRRYLIKQAIYTVLAAATTLPISNLIRLNTSDTNELRNELRNKFVPLASAIDTPDRKKEYIYNPDENNPWISYSEMLIQFRNAAMALNTWSTLAKRSGKKDHLEKAYFFAAIGHTDSRNIFLKGPEKAEEIMELFAQTLLTQSIPLLMQKAETLKNENGVLLSFDNEQKEQWVMGNLLEYYRSFLEPIAIKPDESSLLVKEEEPLVYPKTQKSVFIDVLRESIIDNKNNPSKLKILISLLNRIEDEILTNGVNIDTTELKNIEVEVGRTIFDPSSSERETSIRKKINELKSTITNTDTLLRSENKVLEGGALVFNKDILDGTTMKYINDEKMFLGIERFRGSDVPIFRTSQEIFHGYNNGNQDERVHLDYAIIEGIPVIIRKFVFKKLIHQEYQSYIYESQTTPTTASLLDGGAKNNNSIIKGIPLVISTNANIQTLIDYPNIDNAEIWMSTNESDEDPLGITQLIITN